MAVKFVTFGYFDIFVEGQSVLKRSKRVLKSIELLKFFIAHRRRKLLPETIIENLWPDTDSNDPKNALRIQVFRMRKDLQKMGIGENGDCYIDFVYENGFYIFHVDGCDIDVDIFEESIKNADLLRTTDPDTAIDVYKEAINIYGGDFLEENAYSEWVFPIRSRYHRLYVHSLLRLMELLKDKARYESIVKIYEQAVAIEPFEEALHIYFIEALVELGEYNNALSHYNYITGRIHRELSVRPTSAMKSLYRRIVSRGKEHRSTALKDIGQELMVGDKLEGALYCELDHFKMIYHLERRRSLRSGHSAFLGLVSVVAESEDLLNTEEYPVADLLKNSLAKSLRKGDVFSRWGSHQMLLLLTDVVEANLHLISTRVKKNFANEIKSDNVNLDISYQSVASKESFIF